MRLHCLLLAAGFTLLLPPERASAQDSFADAINLMEELVFRKATPERSDLGTMDSVLTFVLDELPSPAASEPYRLQQAPRQTTERRYFRDECGRLCWRDVKVTKAPATKQRVEWVKERRCSRDACGRVCWRDVWVKRSIEEQPKYAGPVVVTPLRQKIADLQNAIAEFGIDPNVTLRDLALQVYSVTLTADTDSEAGKIRR